MVQTANGAEILGPSGHESNFITSTKADRDQTTCYKLIGID